MNPFRRALADALKYWHLLALSLVCSAGVAVLWGANIAALFPIIEVTLHGKSLPTWNREQHAKALARTAELRQEIADLEARLAAAPPQAGEPAAAPPQAGEPAAAPLGAEPEAELLAARNRLAKARNELQVETLRSGSTARLQPWLDRCLPDHPFSTIVLVAGLVIVGSLLKHILLLSNQMLVAYVSVRIARDIRTRLFDRALALDRPTYMKVGAGGFAAQITHTTETLAHGITAFYGGAVTEPLKIIVCLIGAAMISWQLTLCSLLFAPLVVLMILWLNRRLKAVARNSLNRSLGFHHVILESLSNLLTVQAYTMEPFERDRFRKSTDAMLRNSLQHTFYNSLTGPITELLGIGMVCTAIVVGSYLVIGQQTTLFGIRIVDQPLSASGLMVFFGMLISINDPVRKLSMVLNAVNSGSVAANSIHDMLGVPPKIVDPVEPRTLAKPHEVLEFRNVSFAYDERDPVLQGIDLTIRRGERLAIVGPNGGGKSTLISLLCRFYDPTGGDILLDGVPLRDIPLRELRGRLALVTQQTELFHETVLFNIRYGRWDATDEDAVAAAKQAHAHEFVTGFPDGYDTIVGPGGQRLSGGQRQRLTLARAILRDAEILILDEATSQIDVDGERLIHDALESLGRDRTVIMITHRASTLALADRVVRLDQGVLTPYHSRDLRAA